MKTIQLSKIKVPRIFSQSKPNQKKYQYVLKYIMEHGTLDKPLVVCGDNMLKDGYMRYLAAYECGLNVVPYVTWKEKKEGMTVNYNGSYEYVVAMFHHCQKEYIWKNPKRLPVSKGDKVLCKSKDRAGNNSTVVATVVDVFESNDPRLLKHKDVIKVWKNEECTESV